MSAMSKIEWFILRDGREHGPLTIFELRIFVSEGYLKDSDLVRRYSTDLSERDCYIPPNEIRSYFRKGIEFSSENGQTLASKESTTIPNKTSIIDLIEVLASEAVRCVYAAVALISRPKKNLNDI
jgi:hypothetical protein